VKIWNANKGVLGKREGSETEQQNVVNSLKRFGSFLDNDEPEEMLRIRVKNTLSKELEFLVRWKRKGNFRPLDSVVSNLEFR
jgi:hypothetical protein